MSASARVQGEREPQSDFLLESEMCRDAGEELGGGTLACWETSSAQSATANAEEHERRGCGAEHLQAKGTSSLVHPSWGGKGLRLVEIPPTPFFFYEA